MTRVCDEEPALCAEPGSERGEWAGLAVNLARRTRSAATAGGRESRPPTTLQVLGENRAPSHLRAASAVNLRMSVSSEVAFREPPSRGRLRKPAPQPVGRTAFLMGKWSVSRGWGTTCAGRDRGGARQSAGVPCRASRPPLAPARCSRAVAITRDLG